MEELRGYEKVLRHVGGELSQAFIEGEVALPVGKPEMARVLMVKGWAETGSVELLDGRAMTDGTLTLNVCYLCEMGNVHSFESVSTFKHTADTAGAKPGMKGFARAWASGVEYSMTDARRLNVSAVVDVMFQIEDEMQLNAVRAEDLPEDVIARTVDLDLYKNACRAASAIEIEGECAISQGMPAIESVLCCDGYALVTEAFAEDGSVGVQGELKLEIIYASQDEAMPICQFFASIPFSDMIAAPGAEEGQQVMARAKLKDVFARVDEEAESVHIEAVCTVDVSCEDKFTMSAVQDAYSVSSDVSLEKREIKSKVRSADSKGKYAIKEKVASTQDAMPTNVMAAVASASAPRAVSGQDSLVIETVLFCQVVYINQDGVPHSEFFELPARMEEDVPGFMQGQQAHAVVYVDQVQCTFTGAEFELRVLLNREAEQYSESTQSIVCSIDTEEIEETPESGIIVCFATEKDTLWTIAKRYRVSTDEILRYNPQAEEGIQKGDKLILMQRPCN